MFGNLRVGVVLCDQAEDLTLALGQFGECLRELSSWQEASVARDALVTRHVSPVMP